MQNKNNFEVGQNIVVDIVKPQKGNFPIGRHECGIICKLQLGGNIKFIPYGSTCDCEIVEVREKSLMVKVDYIIKSPEQNKIELDAKIDELKKSKLSNKKHNKSKKQYPFLSKQELNKAVQHG